MLHPRSFLLSFTVITFFVLSLSTQAGELDTALAVILKPLPKIADVLEWKSQLDQIQVKKALTLYREKKDSWQKELVQLGDPQTVLLKSTGVWVKVGKSLGEPRELQFKVFRDHVDLILPGVLGSGSDSNKTTGIRIDPETGAWDIVQTLRGTTPREVERIEREARISQKLQNKPNILPMKVTSRYHLLSEPHLEMISMYSSWSEKGTVAQWLKTNPTIKERAQVALGIVNGAAQMEQVQVVHHDLKTDNVLLGANLTPFWTDFGESDELENYPQYLRGYLKSRSYEKVAAAALPTLLKDADLVETSEKLRQGKISLSETLSQLNRRGESSISDGQRESLDRAIYILDLLKKNRTDVYALGLVLYEVFHLNQHPVIQGVKLPSFIELALENYDLEAVLRVTRLLFKYEGRSEKLEGPLLSPESKSLNDVDRLIRKMLDQSPQSRPSRKEVYETLKEIFPQI